MVSTEKDNVRCASSHLPLPFFSFRCISSLFGCRILLLLLLWPYHAWICRHFSGDKRKNIWPNPKQREDKKKIEIICIFRFPCYIGYTEFLVWDDDAKKYNDSHTHEHINRHVSKQMTTTTITAMNNHREFSSKPRSNS